VVRALGRRREKKLTDRNVALKAGASADDWEEWRYGVLGEEG
jgi:hypothetical protein